MFITNPLRWILVLVLLPSCTNLFFFPDRDQRILPSEIGLEYRDVFIDTPDGVKLHAWWLPARGEPKGTVYFLHGNAENITGHIASVFWLPTRGFNALLLDYRGYGRSEGQPDLEGALADIHAGLDWLVAQPDVDANRVVVFGQSLGGALTLRAVAAWPERARLKGVVIEGAFANYPDMAADALGRTCLAPFGDALSWLLVSGEHNPEDFIGSLSPLPLLIVHSRADEVVPFHHGERLAAAAKQPGEFWPVDKASHIAVFKDKVMQDRLVEWLERQLGE